MWWLYQDSVVFFFLLPTKTINALRNLTFPPQFILVDIEINRVFALTFCNRPAHFEMSKSNHDHRELTTQEKTEYI